MTKEEYEKDLAGRIREYLERQGTPSRLMDHLNWFLAYHTVDRSKVKRLATNSVVEQWARKFLNFSDPRDHINVRSVARGRRMG